MASRKTKEKGFAFGGGLQGAEPGLLGQIVPSCLCARCTVCSRGPVPIRVTAAVSWARWLCCSSATSCKPALARPCQSWQINSEKYK